MLEFLRLSRFLELELYLTLDVLGLLLGFKLECRIELVLFLTEASDEERDEPSADLFKSLTRLIFFIS